MTAGGAPAIPSNPFRRRRRSLSTPSGPGQPRADDHQRNRSRCRETVIVNPVVLAQGININSLGLSTETFDGLLVGSGNFHSAALDATLSGSGNVGVINGSIPGVGVSLFLGPLPGSVDTTNYLIINSGGTETITFGSEKNTLACIGAPSILRTPSPSTIGGHLLRPIPALRSSAS